MRRAKCAAAVHPRVWEALRAVEKDPYNAQAVSALRAGPLTLHRIREQNFAYVRALFAGFADATVAAAGEHADAVRAAFDTAAIDYGRIDYSLGRDGRVVTWEINTNPLIVPMLLAALVRVTLEPWDEGGAVPVEVEVEQPAAANAPLG